jgi:hypothetical protein
MTDIQPIANPDDLNYQLACDSYRNTSFHPEERAKRDQQSYAADVNGFYAEMLELVKTDQQKAILTEEIERYRQGYLQRFTAYLASHSRCASSMITGPARFPVARQQKYGRWADNKRDEWLDWRKRARAAIEQKLLDARPEEEKEAAEWRAIQRDILGSLHVIHDIDAGRSPYSRSNFVNSIVGKVERLALAGEVDFTDKALQLVKDYNADHPKPAISERHKFWAFSILAMAKAAKHEATASAEPTVEAKGEGVAIISNPQADRVQIVFAAKPDREMIGKLKAEAWNWSRTEGAWQRKLTEAAKASAKRIVGL